MDVVERRSSGALEAAVMRLLWDADGPLTARELQSRFAAQPAPPALTTVLTVLERLRTKHRVRRIESTDGRLTFAAAQSESRHAAETMAAALLAASDRSAALLRFAGALDQTDLELLRRAVGQPAADRPAEQW